MIGQKLTFIREEKTCFAKIAEVKEKMVLFAPIADLVWEKETELLRVKSQI